MCRVMLTGRMGQSEIHVRFGRDLELSGVNVFVCLSFGPVIIPHFP